MCDFRLLDLKKNIIQKTHPKGLDDNIRYILAKYPHGFGDDIQLELDNNIC